MSFSSITFGACILFLSVSFQTKLAEWLILRDSTLDELLRHDGLGAFKDDTGCYLCGKKDSDALYRCGDCGHGSRLCCASCLVTKHDRLELHRIEVSNGF